MHKKPTIAERKQLMAAGFSKEDAVRGYTIAPGLLGTDMQEIKSLMPPFSDEDAARQAVSDGIKIIPVKDLPENFDLKRFGWIDTPENRDAINAYCYPPVVEEEPEPVVEEAEAPQDAEEGYVDESPVEFEFTNEPVEKYFEE